MNEIIHVLLGFLCGLGVGLAYWVVLNIKNPSDIDLKQVSNVIYGRMVEGMGNVENVSNSLISTHFEYHFTEVQTLTGLGDELKKPVFSIIYGKFQNIPKIEVVEELEIY